MLPLADSFFFFNSGFNFKQKHDISMVKETIKSNMLFVMLREEWDDLTETI